MPHHLSSADLCTDCARGYFRAHTASYLVHHGGLEEAAQFILDLGVAFGRKQERPQTSHETSQHVSSSLRLQDSGQGAHGTKVTYDQRNRTLLFTVLSARVCIHDLLSCVPAETVIIEAKHLDLAD